MIDQWDKYRKNCGDKNDNNWEVFYEIMQKAIKDLSLQDFSQPDKYYIILEDSFHLYDILEARKALDKIINGFNEIHHVNPVYQNMINQLVEKEYSVINDVASKKLPSSSITKIEILKINMISSSKQFDIDEKTKLYLSILDQELSEIINGLLKEIDSDDHYEMCYSPVFLAYLQAGYFNLNTNEMLQHNNPLSIIIKKLAFHLCDPAEKDKNSSYKKTDLINIIHLLIDKNDIQMSERRHLSDGKKIEALLTLPGVDKNKNLSFALNIIHFMLRLVDDNDEFKKNTVSFAFGRFFETERFKQTQTNNDILQATKNLLGVVLSNSTDNTLNEKDINTIKKCELSDMLQGLPSNDLERIGFQMKNVKKPGSVIDT